MACLAGLGMGPKSDCHAGAWTQPHGRLYAEFETSYLRTEHERNHRGDLVPIFLERLSFTDAEYLESSVRLYAEYGWTQRLTIIGKVNGKYAESNHTLLGGAYFDRFRAETRTAGPADLNAGARWNLAHAPFVASAEAQLKLPLGYARQPSDDGPPLGNAEIDSDVRLLLGRSFGRVYASGMAGYRFRGGVYNDEWLYEFELGAKSSDWLGQLRLDGVSNTVEPQDLAGTSVELPLPGGGGAFEVIVGDQDWTKLRASLARRIGGAWVRLSVVELVAGKNSVDGTEFTLGVVVER